VRWVGHVALIEKMIISTKFESKCLKGTHRLEDPGVDNIKMKLKGIGWEAVD
jgi:hypothetical protein